MELALLLLALLLLALVALGTKRSAFLDTRPYPALTSIQAHWQDMAQEATALLAVPVHPTLYRPEDAISRSPGALTRFVQSVGDNDRWINSWKHEGKWLSYPLVAMGQWVGGESLSRCPRTLAALAPYLPYIAMAGFSRLTPHAAMTPHTDEIGPAFGTAAVHVCLTGQGTLHVNDERVTQVPGKLIMFDSTQRHWVQNGSAERILLYLTWKL